MKTLKGKTISLTVLHDVTVKDLKNFFRHEEIHPKEQRLIFKGKQLENDLSAIDCGIKDGSEMFLVERTTGGGFSNLTFNSLDNAING